MEGLIIPLVIVVLVIAAVVGLTGFVIISERQVGIIVKRFSSKPLPPDRLIALNGGPVIRPIHWLGFPLCWFSRMYSIRKVNVTVVPSGETLAVAPMAIRSAERILAKDVDCDDFQDAQIRRWWEKYANRILTAGAYRINGVVHRH
jgi:uncharacterized membrane protein YqiK